MRARPGEVIGGKDLDELVAQSHADGLTDRAVGYGVEVFVDLHVAIRMHLCRAPVEQLEASSGQRPEQWLLMHKSLGAALAVVLHDAGIESRQVQPERRIEIRQGIECLIANLLKEAALNGANRRLDAGLVTRLVRARWQHGEALVIAVFAVGRIDLGIVAMRALTPDFKLSMTTYGATPPKNAHMRSCEAMKDGSCERASGSASRR